MAWRLGVDIGGTFTGPAIVEAVDATTVVPPGWSAAVDARGYFRMRNGTARSTEQGYDKSGAAVVRVSSAAARVPACRGRAAAIGVRATS